MQPLTRFRNSTRLASTIEQNTVTGSGWRISWPGPDRSQRVCPAIFQHVSSHTRSGRAAPSQRVCFRLAFKIRARDIIEQHFILNGKQLAAAPRQMRFECLLVQNEMIEGAVKPVFVDLIVLKLQQIGKRRAAVRILGGR